MFVDYNFKDDGVVSMVDILFVLEEVWVRLFIKFFVVFIGK